MRLLGYDLETAATDFPENNFWFSFLTSSMENAGSLLRKAACVKGDKYC